MPSSVLLSTMKDKVRRGANMETSDEANHFITDAEIYDQLNDELKVTYGKLVAARGARHYEAKSTYQTVNGIAAIGLDALFLQMLAVKRIEGTNGIPLERIMEADKDRVYSRETSEPAAYEIAGDNLILYPTPDNEYTIEVTYVPAFVPLASNQAFDGVTGWENRAVWAVIGYCAQKDDELGLAAFARAKVAELDRQIDELADDRDAGMPMRTQISKPYRWRR